MTTRNDHGQTLATLNQNLNFPLQFAVLDFGLAVRSGGWKHEWKAGKGYGMGAAWVGWAGERCEMLGEVMWEMLCELFFCEILSCLSRYWHDRTLMPDTLTLAEGYHINEHVKLPGSVKCPALGQLVSCAYIISTSKRKHSKRLNFSSFPGAKWVSMFFFNPVGSSEKKKTHENRQPVSSPTPSVLKPTRSLRVATLLETHAILHHRLGCSSPMATGR